MAEIVVVGSLNMDLMVKVKRLPSHGETIMANHFQISPGGKGANQAVAAARLGAEVSMVGRVGMDSYAEILLSNLQSSNVDTSHVMRENDLPTGVALITIDDTGSNTIVVFQGANGKCTPQDVEAAEELISGAKALVIQLEIPIETVETALKVAKKHSVVTVLNPSPARRIPENLLSNVDILIPNEVEAATLCGFSVHNPDTAFKAAENLLRLGASRVAVTLGKEGTVFAGPEGRLYIPAFPVDALDSTGAGDAFIAAFAVALTEGMEVEESLRYACAVGAIATTRIGAQIPVSIREEAEQLMEEAYSPKSILNLGENSADHNPR